MAQYKTVPQDEAAHLMREGKTGADYQQPDQNVKRDQNQDKATSDMLNSLLNNMIGLKDGRGVPKVSLAQQQGYSLNDEAMVQKGTAGPVPYNVALGHDNIVSQSINGIDPQLYGASEQIVNQLQQMTPMIAAAMKAKHSIYRGVPSNFVENRMLIAQQRKREESMYAFA